MSNPSISLRQVFEAPQGADQQKSSDGWTKFQSKIADELKGVKTAALPDTAGKLAELFDIPIPNILLASWQKADALQSLLEESKKNPEEIMELELAEHTITSEHRPRIELKIHNATVKNLELNMQLAFKLEGFILKIQEGAITEVRTGKCEVKGKVDYEGETLLEKKLSTIELPGSISFHQRRED